ncbi:MAG: toprim domain-containing protein [Chromatiaceae bacterium]|nr:toprim domain-containing protein [Chromatiaceae bacterium]
MQNITTNPVLDFSSAIAAAGLGIPDRITPDGKVHRFRCDGDKPGTRNGWYCLHLDGTPAGVYGSWKLGRTETWCAIERDLQTPKQRADFQALIKRAKRERDQEQRDAYAKAAERAKTMMTHSEPADPQHPYLVAKQIKPHGIRQQGVALLLPVYVTDELTSIQTIYPDGSKRILKNGCTKGGCYLINDKVRREELLIAEGFATAASLHEEIGAACFVAFNANNLLGVGHSVRRQHPEAKIIICGDDDQWTDGNPGATKARAAALDIGAKLMMPDFSGFDLGTKPTDFNDLARLRRAAQGAAA